MSATHEPAAMSDPKPQPASSTITGKPQHPQPVQFSQWRILLWSIRRELWQHRSIVFAPLAIGVVFVIGTLPAAFHASELIQQLETLPSGPRREILLGWPLMSASSMIQLGMFITALAYCLDALYSERRDRSILFWKSLPVSDTVTVISKAAIPLLVLPLVGFVIIVITLLTMAFVGSIAFAINDGPVSMIWTESRFGYILQQLLYQSVIGTLWRAPVYGWLLLVSGWAPRVPVLWAVIPPAAVALLEWSFFGTSQANQMISSRLRDGFDAAFEYASRSGGPGTMAFSDLMGFALSPALWAGLLVAALFITASVWRRRRAEPT